MRSTGQQSERSRRGVLHLLVAAMLVLCCAHAVAQTTLGAQARLLDTGTALRGQADQLELRLALSQPVPYRVRILASAPRLVVDLNTLDWGAQELGADLTRAVPVNALRKGHLPDGWARMVIDLSAPLALSLSEQQVSDTTGEALIRLELQRVPLEEFEAMAHSETTLAVQTSPALLHPDAPADATPPAPPRRPLVMLDPGHGGIDPGAERDGVREADIVLDFARELRALLLRRGHFDVGMTRDADEFVSLHGRIRAARAAGADLFVSLHADALPEGIATGTVVYLLGDEASDDSAAYLAERHDRADMLAGVDLSRNTDDIARVLMSVAWQDTQPRARALADALIAGMADSNIRMHRRPVQSGAFTVLRAVDMPSVLIELGFMSSPRDLANLQDSGWRARMAEAIADSLEAWHATDLAQQALRRR